MRHLAKIADGIDVAPLAAQLAAHPELWGAHGQRTDATWSPFFGTSDVWLRYRPIEELIEPADFLVSHFAVWYPVAEVLPAAKHIAKNLAADFQAEYLGGVLITRIPAGAKVAPHHDRGSWHAEYMNFKLQVPIRSNAECVNYCNGESAVMVPGEAWFLDNLVQHSVENRGATDRETLIVCLRCEL